MVFQYKADPGQQCALQIEVNRNQRDGVVELKKIDFSTMPLTEKGWKTCVIDLSKFINDNYLLVQFRALSSAAGQIINFDQITHL